MENGLDVSLSDESGVDQWQNGPDLLQNPLDASYSYLGLSSDQSPVTLREETYSPEYNLGDMSGYDVQTLSTLAIYGMCAGFAVSIGTALLSFAVAAVMRVFRGFTTD